MWRWMMSWGLGLVGLTACEDDFGSRTIIDSYRVLGVVAEQPEIGPDDAVEVRIFDMDPTGAPTQYTWSVCLWSLGADADYACVDPQLEVGLNHDTATARIDFGSQGLDLRTQYAQVGPFTASDGSIHTLQDGLDVWVFVTSGPASGRHQRTVKRIRIRDGAGDRNQNPGVDGLAVERLDDARVRLRAQVAADAAEDFSGTDGAKATEELLLTWYSTAGELEPGLTFGAVHETTLRLAAGRSADVFVAVRDGRGGLTVRSARVGP